MKESTTTAKAASSASPVATRGRLLVLGAAGGSLGEESLWATRRITGSASLAGLADVPSTARTTPRTRSFSASFATRRGTLPSFAMHAGSLSLENG